MKRQFIVSLLSLLMTTHLYASETKPNDAEITKIVTTTNEGEINIAKLAQKKAKSEEVRKFAGHMITEHTNNNKNSMMLIRKLELKPDSNNKSEEFKKNSEKTISKLSDLEGAAFDKAYIESQVNIHQKVLNDLEQTLIPSAKNPELKALLEKTRSNVNAHLEHAKKVKTSLQ